MYARRNIESTPYYTAYEDIPMYMVKKTKILPFPVKIAKMVIIGDFLLLIFGHLFKKE